ncbi:unnamed protein product, partial [Sphacelaria rigidula]
MLVAAPERYNKAIKRKVGREVMTITALLTLILAVQTPCTRGFQLLGAAISIPGSCSTKPEGRGRPRRLRSPVTRGRCSSYAGAVQSSLTGGDAVMGGGPSDSATTGPPPLK